MSKNSEALSLAFSKFERKFCVSGNEDFGKIVITLVKKRRLAACKRKVTFLKTYRFKNRQVPSSK